MRALVTGATGFVGSHLVRALNSAGHEVRALHRRTSKLTVLAGATYESAYGDINDLDSLRQASAGMDAVFHVAAVADYWRANVETMREANVEGTRKVLQAAREQGVKRVIFTSSAAAIGLFDDRPANENDPFNLPPHRFPYGHSKAEAEAVVREAVAGGQDIVTLNPVVIMGPGDLNKISGTFILQTKQYGWLTPITSGGISVIDVRDVVRYHIEAYAKGVSGERYILMAQNYPYEVWFSMIADVVGVRKPRVVIPSFLLEPIANTIDLLRRLGIATPIDANQTRLGGRNVFFDGSKAHALFGAPSVDMMQSLRDTYAWYVANGDVR